MAYRALLFCPDDKAARTVTQVLGELEFTVESCVEPFAAVKRLMGEHFDAVVVDCDNEQNATLLFKSARNSTSNQASLAVAVVEGQAGVAKAFRIGANLVLTKPINIEQSKGTLRVARGLLRKGEPAKPGAPASPVATAPTPTPAAVPAKPVPTRPVPVAKPAAPVAPLVAATPRPAVPPVARPAVSAIPAKSAAASSAPVARDTAPPDVSTRESVAPPSAAAPVAPAPRLPVLGSQAASVDVTSGHKAASPAAPAATFGSGAASAPAPARDAQAARAASASPAGPASGADLFEKPSAAAASESHTPQAPAPSFTFGGANAPAESSGGIKKILLGVVAGVLVTAGLYAGWTYIHGRSSQPASSQTAAIPAPVATPDTAKPGSSAPKPAGTTPSTSASSPNTQPAAQPAANAATPATSTDANVAESAPEKEPRPTTSESTKPSRSASSASKAASVAKPEAAPRVVKGGSAPAVQAKPVVPDISAPIVIGMAATGSGAPPPNLVDSTGSAPRPILQTLNISQGVSQGLLIKKVQPTYPRNALAMHVEGAVQLMATVSTSGNITSVKVLSGEQLLTKAAVDAVKQWKYKPYQLNGEPVEIQTQVTVNFKLPH